MLSTKALLLIVAPLLDTMRAAVTRTTRDLTGLRTAIGITVYFAMLDATTIAAYALWVGPQRFGVTESWPLVFYFVVSYLGTVLVAAGVVAVVRAGPGRVRRVS
jgi:hypothetical protein